MIPDEVVALAAPVTAIATVALVVASFRLNILIARLNKEVDVLREDVDMLMVRSLAIPTGHKPHTIFDESGPGAWAASISPTGEVERHHYFKSGIPKGLLMFVTEENGDK